MGEFSEQDRDLYRRLDEVLHYVWDPIGIAGVPAARDEYYSYLPQVFELVKSRAEPAEIANCLGSITSKRMGLAANHKHDLKIAEILLDWREMILERR